MEMNDINGQIVVHEDPTPLVVGGFLIFFDFIALLVMLSIDARGNMTVRAGYGFCAAFFAAAILFLLDYFLRRLTIGDYECAYRSMFGRERRFSVQEIEQVKVTVGLDIIRLYDHNGKRLAMFETNMIGTGKAVAYLKKRGIPFVKQEGMLIKMLRKTKTEETHSEPNSYSSWVMSSPSIA